MVNRPIRIIVACGASIAQSTMLQMMISGFLDRKKIPYNINKCTFAELQSKVKSFNPDFVYTAGNPPFKMPEGLPAFNGLNIITGVGRDKMLDELYSMIEGLEK